MIITEYLRKRVSLGCASLPVWTRHTLELLLHLERAQRPKEFIYPLTYRRYRADTTHCIKEIQLDEATLYSQKMVILYRNYGGRRNLFLTFFAYKKAQSRRQAQYADHSDTVMPVGNHGIDGVRFALITNLRLFPPEISISAERTCVGDASACHWKTLLKSIVKPIAIPVSTILLFADTVNQRGYIKFGYIKPRWV